MPRHARTRDAGSLGGSVAPPHLPPGCIAETIDYHLTSPQKIRGNTINRSPAGFEVPDLRRLRRCASKNLWRE